MEPEAERRTGFTLPAAPNWYLSGASDLQCTPGWSFFAYGCRNSIALIDCVQRRFVRTLTGHNNRVTGVQFTKGAGPEMLASGSADRTVRVWNVTTGAQRAMHNGHTAEVTAVATSAVGADVVVSGDKDGKVFVWRFPTGQKHGVSLIGKTAVTCLACSPRDGDVAAAGYLNGTVVLFHIDKGTVLNRLVGHDTEIQGISFRPAAPGGTSAEAPLVATSAKDKTVRVWDEDKAKTVRTLTAPRPSGHVSEGQKDRVWISHSWTAGGDQVITSTQSGELLAWRIDDEKGAPRRLASGHSRCVFGISACRGQPDLLATISLDRTVSFWGLSAGRPQWTLPCLGGFVYAMDSSELQPHRLAIAVGDKSIRVWNTGDKANPYESTYFWKGLQTKVSALAWHPAVEGALLYGTEDGKVGVYYTWNSKQDHLASRHKGAVYSVCWGAAVPAGEARKEKGSGKKGLKSLPDHIFAYSCGGDGAVRAASPDGEDSYECTFTPALPAGVKRSEVAWRGDQSALAVGNSDGSVELFDAGFKRVFSSSDHAGLINRARWNTCLAARGKTDLAARFEWWLATASDDGWINVYDASRLEAFGGAGDGPVLVSTLRGHARAVTGLSWSPARPAWLASSSYDGTVQIWDTLEGAPLVNLRGHESRVFCVQWSIYDPDLVYSGSDDQTARCWRISECTEHSKPPQLSKGSRKDKALKDGSNGDAGENGALGPPDSAPKKDTSAKPPPSEPPRPDPGAKKAKKPKTLLAKSNFGNDLRVDAQQSCLRLARARAGDGGHEGPGADIRIFMGRDGIGALLDEEKSQHASAQNWGAAASLSLWQGNVAEAFGSLLQNDQLDGEWLSLSPLAGLEVWKALTRNHAADLRLKGETHQAVLHYVAVGEVHEGIQSYIEAEMYREALALAKTRLPEGDPYINEVALKWAQALERGMSFEQAAKCYLSVGMTDKAIACLARRSDLSGLKTTAELATLVSYPSAKEHVFAFALAASSAGQGPEALGMLRACWDGGIDVGARALVVCVEAAAGDDRGERAVESIERRLEDGLGAPLATFAGRHGEVVAELERLASGRIPADVDRPRLRAYCLVAQGVVLLRAGRDGESARAILRALATLTAAGHAELAGRLSDPSEGLLGEGRGGAFRVFRGMCRILGAHTFAEAVAMLVNDGLPDEFPLETELAGPLGLGGADPAAILGAAADVLLVDTVFSAARARREVAELEDRLNEAEMITQLKDLKVAQAAAKDPQDTSPGEGGAQELAALLRAKREELAAAGDGDLCHPSPVLTAGLLNILAARARNMSVAFRCASWGMALAAPGEKELFNQVTVHLQKRREVGAGREESRPAAQTRDAPAETHE